MSPEKRRNVNTLEESYNNEFLRILQVLPMKLLLIL